MEGTPAYIQMHLLLILHRSHLEGFSNLLSTIHYVPAYINATNYRKRHDKLLISKKPLHFVIIYTKYRDFLLFISTPYAKKVIYFRSVESLL